MKNTSQASAVCTTQRAASILGISVSSVQRLVEAGAIGAWKTRGGHRRLALTEVLAYKAQPGNQLVELDQPDHLRLLMIEADTERREQFQRRYSQWHLPATLEFCSNIYQAMLELARHQPDILLVDLEDNHINGSVMLNTLVGDPKLWTMHIVILSEQDAATLAERGILPQGTVFFGRTVHPGELRDYLQARCVQQLRNVTAEPAAYQPELSAEA
ncbi:excisionase family DNA-binding protein [Duganella qianjiadongensis]|uniref:Excisionase family DNA-binding protein n=1 Tax=Duganella qianjiadongensis TaxID=2692176 RepID=A0ABW9VDN1_9BURK|nr:excisionase family DNA-binding protein [Duganella qianjiadongensis]MYM37729.1 excisionase family DNA-binding protein [Duganella qianjiadongensis]